MKWFGHMHTFDGAKWEKVSEVDAMWQTTSYGVPVGKPWMAGKQLVFKNVCLTCGDLHFRRVEELEQP